MEQKINIAEFLKDCPKGMELDCPMYEDVYFDYVDTFNIIHCYIQHKAHKTYLMFNQHGTPNSDIKSKCVIFPKGKTTWEGFHKPFEDGDIVAYGAPHLQICIFKDKKENNTLSDCYLMLDVEDDELYLEDGMYYVTRFATEEEKKKLFDAIKSNGYHWNAETKTLTRLTPNKFDITTLKPFDRVLVRDNNEQFWTCDWFSFHDTKQVYPFTCVGHYVSQCIPYEGNQHLLGTANDCDEFYKNWE